MMVFLCLVISHNISRLSFILFIVLFIMHFLWYFSYPVIGYYIFRASNLQKNAFRENPFSSQFACKYLWWDVTHTTKRFFVSSTRKKGWKPWTPQKVSDFWSLCASAFTFCYETMSNWSQNCWIHWNSAVLCFKWLFYIGVWTFAWFVRPLWCVWEIWSGSYNCVYMYMYHVFHWLAKKMRHRTDFLASPWSETGDIFWRP